MKVKIGNKIYDSEQEPIMLILTDMDKELISTMASNAKKYCSYPEDMAPSEIEKWMRE